MATVDNKKIAKNTIMLYIRMLLIMAVTLYTSRVVLKILGIDDYGIYNLIAGFVTLFSFISNALISSMQRYFNICLGKDDKEQYKQIFSSSIVILLFFCLVIFLLGETIGLWFINNHLNLPEGREVAAFWVYQFSLLTFVANTIRTPYQASIIAHESMSFYAYTGIAEVLLRLCVVFALQLFVIDYLILYALLYFLLVVVINIVYLVYCKRKFTECSFVKADNKKLFRELLSFSGWSIFGQSAIVIKNQGDAILINHFFNVAANAAMGIASQVTGAIDMFVTNFQTAFNPQLTQSYTDDNKLTHYGLISRSAKFSYFLLLAMLLPVVFNIDFILSLWLSEVPQFANYFIVLILIGYLLNALSTPLFVSVLASGHIKGYQVSVFIIFILGLIGSFAVLYLGFEPYSIACVGVFVQLFLLCSRMGFAHRYSSYSPMTFFRNVAWRIIIVSLLSLICPLFFFYMPKSMAMSILSICIDIVWTLIAIYVFGLDNNEKKFAKGLFNKMINK